MGIFQPDQMGGVDYGAALKKIETAIAENKDKEGEDEFLDENFDENDEDFQ